VGRHQKLQQTQSCLQAFLNRCAIHTKIACHTSLLAFKQLSFEWPTAIVQDLRVHVEVVFLSRLPPLAHFSDLPWYLGTIGKMSDMEQYDYMFKLIIIGDSGTGKS
jgi:hypothetical protein